MLITVSKTAFTNPCESMGIGKYPHSEGYYIISATPHYFAAFPIEISFDDDFEYEEFDAEIALNKFIYLPVKAMHDLAKINKGATLQIYYSVQTDYNELIEVSDSYNKFAGFASDRKPFECILPTEPLPRYSLNMNYTGLQVLIGQIKSASFFYVDQQRTMAYAPLGDTGFVGFPCKESGPMKWTKRPNSILNKFVPFVDSEDEESYTVLGYSERLIRNIKDGIMNGTILKSAIDIEVQKFFEFDYIEQGGSTVNITVEKEPLLEPKLLTPEEIEDAARLGIDLSFPDNAPEDEDYYDDDIPDAVDEDLPAGELSDKEIEDAKRLGISIGHDNAKDTEDDWNDSYETNFDQSNEEW